MSQDNGYDEAAAARAARFAERGRGQGGQDEASMGTLAARQDRITQRLGSWYLSGQLQAVDTAQ